MSKIKVFISGNFNVIHPGHLRLLRYAKSRGDYLVIGIQSDKLAGDSAHVPEKLRLEGIKSNLFVDEAFIIKNSVKKAILKIKPDIVIKGKEHEDKYNQELEILDKIGGKLLFSSGNVSFSSFDLIRREIREIKNANIKLPINFMNRNKVTKDDLKKIIKNFKKLKVLILGDLIVDEYINCSPLGMSQEEPSLVVTPIDYNKFIGGAGIVACHAVGLGAHSTFISVSGIDDETVFAKKSLTKLNVNHQIIADSTRVTTLKQRFRANGKSLLRVSKLDQQEISKKIQKNIFNKVKKIINEIDLLVFADFNYGCLPQDLLTKIFQLTKGKKILTVADSQSSSQIGDISRFKDMDMITPTEREARISSKNNEDGLVVLADQLRLISKAKNILLKLGEDGLFIHSVDKEKVGSFITDQIPALNINAKDVAGAGDSLLITSAMSMASGGNIWQSACLGSIAAAIQVSRIGNTPLSYNELLEVFD